MVRYNPLKVVKQDRSMNWLQVKRKYPSLSARGDMDNDGVKNYKDCRPLDPTQHGIFSAIAGVVGAMKGSTPVGENRGQTIKRRWQEGMAKPTFRQRFREQRGVSALARLEKYPSEIKASVQERRNEQYRKATQPIRSATNIAQRVGAYGSGRMTRSMEALHRQSQQAVGRGKYTATQLRQTKALRKGIQSAFPMIPQKALLTYAQASESKGRGRPKGAWATKYAPYNGVYGYRKFIRAQNAAQKYQAILQQAQQRMAQVQQVPTQTGQEVVMQYQQVQPQQQFQQLPQLQSQQQQFQQPQQPQQSLPPIATVFRSSGGHPFKPVNPPLQRTPNSMYYEDTDAFSGERIIKQRPQAEAWIRPKY